MKEILNLFEAAVEGIISWKWKASKSNLSAYVLPPPFFWRSKDFFLDHLSKKLIAPEL
jgi:hypothetical protein